MDKEELQAELDILFNSQPDEDGFFPPEYLPERITKSHKLDISYMDRLDYEGSTVHPYTRICKADEHRLISLSRNHDVCQRLFMSAIQLFGDSLVAYHDKKERKGTVTLMTRILRGNVLKAFHEKAKNILGTLKKNEQPPKTRLNFSISGIAQKIGRPK